MQGMGDYNTTVQVIVLLERLITAVLSGLLLNIVIKQTRIAPILHLPGGLRSCSKYYFRSFNTN
jgi:hypothetical protein